MDFLPFGEQISGGGGSSHKFTGYEYDPETGLDNANARQYSSSFGRFMTPDPAGLAATDLTDPQSWNRFAYVRNSPLNLIDPSGLDPCQGSNDFEFSQAADGTGIFTPEDCTANGGTWGSGGSGSFFISGGGSGGGSGGPGFGNPTLGCDPQYDDNGNLTSFNCDPQNSTGGRGPAIGPRKPTPPPCRIIDPVLGALELVFKAGPEGQVGPFKVGASLYKNVTSGEKGIKAEVNASVFGGQVDSKLIPQNGSYRGSVQPPETSVSFLGFTKNLTTGAPVEFGAQKMLGIGLQLGIGFEIVVNRAKFDALSKANDACRAQGGT